MADLSKIKLNGTEYDLKDAFARDEFQNYVLLSNFNDYLHDADWSVKTMFEIREINNENRYIIRRYQSNDPLQKIAFLFSFLAAADTVFIYTLPNSAQLITLELKEIILGEGENIFNSVQSIILQGENNGNIYTFTFSEGMLNDENILIGLLNITPKITSNDIPVIPTNVSAFTNDAGYLTQHQNISTKANLTDLPLIVTGTCAFGTSLTSGTDAIISITNVSHTVAQIAAAVTANRPVEMVLNNNELKINLKLTTFDGSAYYFTNSYDPFTQTQYDNESFNITVKASNITDVSDSTYDSFVYAITYNKNAFVTQSDMTSAINTAIGGVTEFDTQVVQSLPQTGVEGTIYFTPNNHGTNDVYDEFIYVNNAWEKIGNTQVDLTGYVRTNDLALVATSGDYNNLNNTPNIPEKTSDLTNDSGFVNADTAQDIAWLNFDGTYITDPWKMSELGPLTGNDVYAEYVMTKKAVPIVIYNNSLYYYQSGNSNTDIKYFNPENNTILTHSNNSSIVSINTRTIFSGDYNDLSNKPTLFDGDYNSLSNKPTLFSGSYNDLSDKPTIPSATVVTQTISSGVKIAEINGTAIYAPAYANGDQIAY